MLVKKCTCGNTEFHAHQRCYLDVVVDSDNNFLVNEPDDWSCIYESETPYGPYTCTKCGREYEDLDKLPLMEEGGEEAEVAPAARS